MPGYVKILQIIIITLLTWPNPGRGEAPKYGRSSVHVIPVNAAEAIIEPFWDPGLSGLAEWDVQDGSSFGLKVWQNWAWAAFEWQHKPTKNPALSMSREFNIDCSEYNRLVVSIMAPKNSRVRLQAKTDIGTLSFEAPPAGIHKAELGLDLNGAKKLIQLTLEVSNDSSGVLHGWINWIGLQHTDLLARHHNQWKHYDAQWEGYLKPESYEPQFVPAYGLIVDEKELNALRQKHADLLKKWGTSPFIETARKLADRNPENYIGEYVVRINERFNRASDEERIMTVRPGYGYQLALAGLLQRDKKLLRLGARHVLSIAACENWDEGFVSNFPGGGWNQRCFSESVYAFETALILDLAGDYFTDMGRDYIMRRLAEEGLGAINYNIWKYDYIFHNNQLSWFSNGRMAALLVLEKEWPRIHAQVELAYQDILENLHNVILPDGGDVEGPTYFQPIAGNSGVALYMYARSRQKTLAEVMPDELLRTANFAAAIVSTDARQDAMPICDGRGFLDHNVLAILSTALPQSQWVKMWHKKIAREASMPDMLVSLALFKPKPENITPPPAFIFLPDMGIMASTRQLGKEIVKIFIMGNKANAGHSHEDKGSFILEFAGETFAMDPGICNYGNPLHLTLKHCSRHNMLVPYGVKERPAPERPLPYDVKPVGQGDSLCFKAEINVTPGWEKYYQKWHRSWNSPTPDELKIRDEYELIQGNGVEFCWSTQLPVKISPREVTIIGKRGTVTLKIPADCQVNLEELPMITDGIPSLSSASQKKIIFRKPGKTGRIEVVATLRLN